MLSVFKEREAKLNRAIIFVLNQRGSMVIYDITKLLRKQKTFRYTRYTTVNRRVKALKASGYLEEAGTRKVRSGQQSTLYQATTRAQVALIFSRISLDEFIKTADEETLETELSALLLYFEKYSAK